MMGTTRRNDAGEAGHEDGLAQAEQKGNIAPVTEFPLCMLRKRIGATLKALHNKGLVRQDGYVGAHIGWRVAAKQP